MMCRSDGVQRWMAAQGTDLHEVQSFRDSPDECYQGHPATLGFRSGVRLSFRFLRGING